MVVQKDCLPERENSGECDFEFHVSLIFSLQGLLEKEYHSGGRQIRAIIVNAAIY